MSTLLLSLILLVAGTLMFGSQTPRHFRHLCVVIMVLMGISTGMLWAYGCHVQASLIASLLPCSRQHDRRTRKWRLIESRLRTRINRLQARQWHKQRSSRIPWNYKPPRSNTAGQCTLVELERRADSHYRGMVQVRGTMDAAEAADSLLGMNQWAAVMDGCIPGWQRRNDIITPPTSVEAAWHLLAAHAGTVTQVQSIPGLAAWLQLTAPLLWLGLQQLLSLWALHPVHNTWRGAWALAMAAYSWANHRPASGRRRCFPSWSSALRLVLYCRTYTEAYASNSALTMTGVAVEAVLAWYALPEPQRAVILETAYSLAATVWPSNYRGATALFTWYVSKPSWDWVGALVVLSHALVLHEPSLWCWLLLWAPGWWLPAAIRWGVLLTSSTQATATNTLRWSQATLVELPWVRRAVDFAAAVCKCLGLHCMLIRAQRWRAATFYRTAFCKGARTHFCRLLWCRRSRQIRQWLQHTCRRIPACSNQTSCLLADGLLLGAASAMTHLLAGQFSGLAVATVLPLLVGSHLMGLRRPVPIQTATVVALDAPEPVTVAMPVQDATAAGQLVGGAHHSLPPPPWVPVS